MERQTDQARQGRRIALVIAGTGLIWIAATALGGALDWSQRTRALFDLAALAGFGWAIWMIYGLWRSRQTDKG
jgi:threonine/homoserine/homoserine lactone efflux protein